MCQHCMSMSIAFVIVVLIIQREREGEREREIYQSSVIPHCVGIVNIKMKTSPRKNHAINGEHNF